MGVMRQAMKVCGACMRACAGAVSTVARQGAPTRMPSLLHAADRTVLTVHQLHTQGSAVVVRSWIVWDGTQLRSSHLAAVNLRATLPLLHAQDHDADFSAFYNRMADLLEC